MKALQAYVDRKHRWDLCFDKTAKPLDLSLYVDRARLADIIDSALSPENLSCDGELPISETRRRYKELVTVANQLRSLDPSIEFSEI